MAQANWRLPKCWAGHKTLQMVKSYSHLSEDHTRSVVEKMAGKIFEPED